MIMDTPKHINAHCLFSTSRLKVIYPWKNANAKSRVTGSRIRVGKTP